MRFIGVGNIPLGVPADIETHSLELPERLAARFGEIGEKVRSEIAAFAASPRP